MAQPTIDTNLVGTQVYPVADLSMSVFLASGASSIGTFTTGLPATVLVLAALTSGAGNLTVTTGATVAALNYNGSAATSIALSGTALQVVSVNTSSNATALNQDYTQLDQYTTLTQPSSALFVGVATVAGTYTNMYFNQFAILVLFELVGGEDWYCVRSGSPNAVAGTWGNYPLGNDPKGYQDGSGSFSLTIA